MVKQKIRRLVFVFLALQLHFTSGLINMDQLKSLDPRSVNNASVKAAVAFLDYAPGKDYYTVLPLFTPSLPCSLH